MNETQFCISPVKFLLVEIYGESIWPVNIGVHNDLPHAAVHSCPLYPGCFTPVSPVHVPERDTHTNEATRHAGIAALGKAWNGTYIQQSTDTNVYSQMFTLAHLLK